MPSTDAKCVLVVDDDETIRALVSDVLKLRGYRVDTASDGLQGLMKARTARPDAIVLDLMMPVMDGWTFLELYGREPSFAGRPVVVLSAVPDLTEVASRPQVRAILAKPFDIYVLADTVERLLQMPPVKL